jgi:hypothetical protein
MAENLTDLKRDLKRVTEVRKQHDQVIVELRKRIDEETEKIRYIVRMQMALEAKIRRIEK